jgi:collagen type VII alpha
MKKILIIALILIGIRSFAQQNVSISDVPSTPNPTSVLDVSSTTKGMLIPRLTTAQRNAIQGPANGLLVYDTDVKCVMYYSNATNSWGSLCDGANLSNLLSNTVNVPAGTNCANGGILLQLGSDTNGNGNLDASEITSTDYLCNGASGATGPQGPIGLTGATGPQGPTGLTGPQGPIGLTGATGPQGPIGLTGVTGQQGPIGLTGPIGPIGLTGATGPQGPIGLTGPQGATGLTGATGPQGPAGADGAQGLQGPIGLTGPQGPAGADGAQGPQGPTGLTGPQGPTGADGAQGPQGPIGLTGPQGPPGADGAQGSQGPIGLTGPQGPAGADGAQGPIGLTGPQGVAGTTGPQGPQGVAGPQGPPVTANFYGVYASRTTISSLEPNFTQISGLSQSLNITSVPAKVFINTTGNLEVQSCGAFSNGGTGCIIEVTQNGSIVPQMFQVVDINDAQGVCGTIGIWSMVGYVDITLPGTYTFSVKAAKYFPTFDNFYAGGNSTAPTAFQNHGSLILQVYY